MKYENISSVEEGTNKGFVAVTQTMPKSSPIQLEYEKNLLYQAPKNGDIILKANLLKIYNDLLAAKNDESKTTQEFFNACLFIS